MENYSSSNDTYVQRMNQTAKSKFAVVETFLSPGVKFLILVLVFHLNLFQMLIQLVRNIMRMIFHRQYKRNYLVWV